MSEESMRLAWAVGGRYGAGRLTLVRRDVDGAEVHVDLGPVPKAVRHPLPYMGDDRRYEASLLRTPGGALFIRFAAFDCGMPDFEETLVRQADFALDAADAMTPAQAPADAVAVHLLSKLRGRISSG